MARRRGCSRETPEAGSPRVCEIADGLFIRSGIFHVLPATGLKPLEELFRVRVITFLMDKGLLRVERANMLCGWLHSGFNVHRSRRVLPDGRGDLERLVQCIIRNPFAVEKMQVSAPNRANPEGSVLYRSGLNPKIQRNFEVFTPCDLIAAITQHIPDKSFQLVHYYGWYSNKMPGQRDKRAAERAETAKVQSVQIIDVSEHKSRRIPSAQWRELIKKAREDDPLVCPICSREMCIAALIDELEVVERILRHLGLWEQGVRVHTGADPPAECIIEPLLENPLPDYDTEPVLTCANS